MSSESKKESEIASGEHEGITRRKFLISGTTLGVVTATGGLGAVLAACTTQEPSGTSTTLAGTSTSLAGATTTSAPTLDLSGVIYGDLYPQLPRGGTLDIAITQTADTLNILANTLGAISWQADPAHDFLERYDHTGTLVPSLAESIEAVDAATFRYVLRAATFHNGRSVTAEDVQQVIEWVRDPANGSARASTYEGVEVEVEDDRTVVLRLPGPNAGFRHNLPRLPIVPIEEIASQEESPVGCGPFLFQEWVRDSHIEYVANPDYWNSEAPRVDTLRITTLSDPIAGANSFLAGQHAFVEGIPVGIAPDFSSRADAGEFEIGSFAPGWVFLAFQNEVEPFDNPDVKRAMNLALDRSAIAQAFGGALGSEPISTGPLAPTHAWFPADLTVERNVDEARSLLASAGYPDGFSGKVLRAEEWAGTPDVAAVVQANWADIGIDVDIEVTDSPTYVQRRTDGDFDVYISGWFITPEPAFVLDTILVSTSTANYWRYNNAEVDELLATARASTDDEERRELYLRVMQIAFMDDPAMLPLCTEVNFFAYRTGVNGDQFRPEPGPLFHYPIAAISA